MKTHFIGIGGIGVSALAQYYLSKGHKVSGSDLAPSEVTDLLKKLGAKIFIGPHNEKNIDKDVDLVIYSPAVQKDNPELKEAKRFHASGFRIQVLSYPQALGDLTKQYFTIAVSGTHGKSTTTAMIALVLIKAGFDPTVIVGTKLKEFNNTNFRAGESKYLVIEADEWSFSFLNYWPKIIVLNNIEEEHLDCYKDLDHILKTYKTYIGHLPEDGILVANKDDKNIIKIIEQSFVNSTFSTIVKNVIYYSMGHSMGYSVGQEKGQKEVETLRKILKAPGEHNVYNALAALTTARILGVPDEVCFEALSEYQGAWRRFEIIKGDKATIVSDYGHHPTEVKATLEAVREKFPDNRIFCVFQPHQHQRTFYLFDDFVKVFSKAPIDEMIITDIYDVAGREEGAISSKVSSKKLVEAINRSNVIYLAKEEIKSHLDKKIENGHILLIMGAGDIYKLVYQFVNPALYADRINT